MATLTEAAAHVGLSTTTLRKLFARGVLSQARQDIDLGRLRANYAEVLGHRNATGMARMYPGSPSDPVYLLACHLFITRDKAAALIAAGTLANPSNPPTPTELDAAWGAYRAHLWATADSSAIRRMNRVLSA